MKPSTCIGVGKRRRELAELLSQRLVTAADDDELDRQARASERERRGEQFAAALAAGHQHDDGRIGRQSELRAKVGLASGDVVELRMDRMAEQAQPRGRNAARERALIDFARRHDDRVGLRNEPRLVHLPEVGDHRDDGNVLHARHRLARAARRD